MCTDRGRDSVAECIVMVTVWFLACFHRVSPRSTPCSLWSRSTFLTSHFTGLTVTCLFLYHGREMETVPRLVSTSKTVSMSPTQLSLVSSHGPGSQPFSYPSDPLDLRCAGVRIWYMRNNGLYMLYPPYVSPCSIWHILARETHYV